MKRNRWGVFGMAIVGCLCSAAEGGETGSSTVGLVGWSEMKLYRRRGTVHVTGHRRDG